MGMTDRRVDLRASGLTRAEAEQRIAAGHANTLPDGPSRTTAEIVRANLLTRFNVLLGALLVVVLFVIREPRDALFGIVLVSNAAIGIVQELRAKRTLDRLEVVAMPRVHVLRDGVLSELTPEELVLDDVIEVAAGDQIPVDGVVVASQGLEIDESLLTGESDAIAKLPGDRCLSGSFVAAGSGRFRATRVGAEAYAVKLAQEAKRFTLVRSELRDGIDWIIRVVSYAVVPMIALLVWAQLTAGEAFNESLRGGVAGAVGMIPQGLVLLTSLAFAVGVIRLGRSNVLVKELPAIEGLARVDTVCFDKTGTLTMGKLSVHEVVRLADVDVASPLAALAATDPNPNATQKAVLTAYADAPDWPATATVPFSSKRKWSGATFAAHGTWILGAPSVVIPEHAKAMTEAEGRAVQGQRVLALAYTRDPLVGDALPARLEPVALLSLGDTIRPDAASTLQYFAEQGVAAKVISGDHPATVAAIARATGVPGSADVVDAKDLPEDPEQLAKVVEESSVFGRVTPHQKQAMVAALQSGGHVVAMTGDGVNDVLALKDSDIGIAVGSGAPASRAVAQLVLLDGQFSRLPSIVAEGRRVIANIERVANLFVTKTVYAIVLAIAIGVVALPFPFLPRHLTLVGAITIGIPAFFLALAPNAHRAQPGMVGRVLRFALPTGVVAAVATFGAYQLAISEGVKLEEARTVAVLVLTAIGLFALTIVSRPLVPWKKSLIASMAGLLLLAMISGPSHEFFELNLPRPAVLFAGVGILAITGSAMVGTLRLVGWVKTVPDLLRQYEPTETALWQTVRERLRPVRVRTRTMPPEPLVDPSPPAEQPSPESAEPIDWIDPDELLARPIEPERQDHVVGE